MDIAQMKPAAKKAAAKPTAKGTSGAALGVLILKQADATAEAEIKQAESRKTTLARLIKFTRDDHLAFRTELGARLDTYKLAAETLGLTLEAYRKNDPKVNSVTVTVSMWRKLSEAVETGFRPDLDSGWAEISLKATEALQSKAMDHVGTPENPQRAAPVIKKKGRPGKTNVEKGLAVLDGMPAQDLETIGLWIASKLGKTLEFKAIKA